MKTSMNRLSFAALAVAASGMASAQAVDSYTPSSRYNLQVPVTGIA